MPDPETGGTNIGNPAGFIAGLIREGEGPTSGLDRFRDAGGAIRNDTWFRLYGQVSDTLARRPDALALEPDVIPSASQYGTWQMGSGDEYATQVALFSRDQETGLLVANQYTHVTADPHTPAEAEAAAQAQFFDDDNAAAYGEVGLGAIATALWTTTPWSAG